MFQMAIRILLSLTLACYPILANQGFQKILKQFKDSEVSFLAISSKTGKIIEERNPNLLLNPASNTKLVTTLAALEILHPEYRFKTEYWAGGPIENGVLKGDLIVKGFGDPSITTERLQKVARQLHLIGIQSIDGALVLDESYFGGETAPRGWEKELGSSKLYTTVPSALSLNNNMAHFYLTPNQVGSNAHYMPDPPCDFFKIDGEIKTVSKGNRPKIAVREDGKCMKVSLGGTVSSNLGSLFVRKKVFHPTQYFASVLSHFLKKEGITVEEGVKISSKDIKGSKLLITDKSPILSEVIAATNKSSSNFMAEMLVKAIAGKKEQPAKYETGLKAISDYLETKLKFKPGTFVFANGSGLGPYNRFSAQQFVKLLQYAQKNFEVSSEFMASLGVAGTQGTLSKRMKNGPALRRVRAKTGTLSGVSSLSGYIDTEGDDTIIFSILLQGRSKVMRKARSLEDRIGAFFSRMRTEKEPEIIISDTVTNGDSNEDIEEDSEDIEELSGG